MMVELKKESRWDFTSEVTEILSKCDDQKGNGNVMFLKTAVLHWTAQDGACRDPFNSYLCGQMSKALGISGFAFHKAAKTESLTKPDCSKFQVNRLHLLSNSHCQSGRVGHCLQEVSKVGVWRQRYLYWKQWLICNDGTFRATWHCNTDSHWNDSATPTKLWCSQKSYSSICTLYYLITKPWFRSWWGQHNCSLHFSSDLSCWKLLKYKTTQTVHI